MANFILGMRSLFLNNSCSDRTYLGHRMIATPDGLVYVNDSDKEGQDVEASAYFRPLAIYPALILFVQLYFKLKLNSRPSKAQDPYLFEAKSAAMVLILKSQTFPINPPGVEPVLSIEQVWEVLQIKCRTPEKFIPAMASTTVLEENEKGLSREVIFRDVKGPGVPPSGKVIEDLTFFKPWKVMTPSSSQVTMISQGLKKL